MASASPKFAEQVFDSTILHSADNVGVWIQEAIFEVTGVDLRETNSETGELYFDGNIGPKTRAAIEKAVESGAIKTIHNLVVDKRLAYMAKRRNYATFKNGWVARAESFRQP